MGWLLTTLRVPVCYVIQCVQHAVPLSTIVHHATHHLQIGSTTITSVCRHALTSTTLTPFYTYALNAVPPASSAHHPQCLLARVAY